MAAALCLLTVAWVGSACGVRTPPRSPSATAVPLGALRAERADDGSVKLRWKRPKHSADGETLYDLSGFVIERRLGDEFVEIARLDVTDHERVRPQQNFSFTDGGAPPDAAEYRVWAYDSFGQAGPPSTVSTEAAKP